MPQSATLFDRPDTMFGVCEGLGRDIGIHPNILRVAFGVALLWQPIFVIAAYAALGVAVYAARFLFPVARGDAAPAAAAAPAPDEEAAAAAEPERLAA